MEHPDRRKAEVVRLAGASRAGHPGGMAPDAAIRTLDDVRALFAHLAGQPREVIGVAYLDAEWRVLGVRHSPAGSADAATVPLRAIARDAVAFRAVRVVMAHNHPSGDPTPSVADIRATRRLARALAALGTPLVEHLVLAVSGHVSLRRAGIV